MLQGPPHPWPLSPKGARDELILLPSPLWGRGWLESGVFTSRGETGEGVSLLVNSHMARRTSFLHIGRHRNLLRGNFRSPRDAGIGEDIGFIGAARGEFGNNRALRTGLEPMPRAGHQRVLITR